MAGQYLKVLEKKLVRVSPTTKRRKKFARSHLELRMFNVKEGEAILLVFPKKRTWILDCGTSNFESPNSKLGKKLAEYLKKEKLVLEALVASHAHADHAGAFTALLQAKPKLAKKVVYWRNEGPSWKRKSKWIPKLNKELNTLGSKLEQVAVKDALHHVDIAKGVRVHLFAGSGSSVYTSLFVHVHYKDARLLFTGDAECGYEKKLLAAFCEDDFRADVLKVTHHGSSSGTAKTVVKAVKQGIAIVSTAEDDGHRLEKDTLKRLGGLGKPRRVFETHVDGDIILRTDGGKYSDGVLYRVDVRPPGEFAKTLGATVAALSKVNEARRTSPKHKKKCQ